MGRDVKKFVGEYLSAWHSHDVNNILPFFDDDCVFEDVALKAVYRGKKQVAAFIKMLLLDFPDIKFELNSVFGSSEWVAMEWVWSGTHVHSSVENIPATGKTFSVREAIILQLHNDKISRESDYCDMTTFLKQVGLVGK